MRAPRFLPLVLLLFAGSGCAALIHEVVWLQLLQFVIGSSAVSLAVLLGTFMGGMCLGSLALPRWLPPNSHPLRLYAALEAGIAIAAIAGWLALPAIGRLYLALVGHGFGGILLRGAVCAACLLPPTILMGATLPAVANWVRQAPHGVAWLGLFYGGNTLGAVLGCVLAGFHLLRVHDSTVATLFAVALNLTVAVSAWLLARLQPGIAGVETPRQGGDEIAKPPGEIRLPSPTATRQVLAVLALSGLCALAAEVVWTRLLSLLLGATVYTFSIILAVFLVGLGIGSSSGAAIARDTANARRALAWCQWLQVAAVAWAANATATALPHWTVEAAAAAGGWAKLQVDVLRCAWAILPSALLWGASFPLAVASLPRFGHEPARVVGRAYAANTSGAIVGAVLSSLLLIPALGTRHAQAALIVISGVSGLIAWAPSPRMRVPLGGAVLALAIAVAWSIPSIPWQLVAYGRQVAVTDYGARPLYFGEGMNSSVAVSETADGARFFHVSGKTEASSLVKDMRLQRMLGHIPALLHPHPRSVLIVGCGAGVTAGTFVLHPSIERIVICDIEPLIPDVVATFFRAENHDVLRDPRVRVVHDDARHYIATTHESFDIITSDPIHPWVKGSAMLYSQEYFQLCRQRLNPGGLLTQWVPLYEADRGVVQSELATFFSVFPRGTIWANDDDGYGYDTVLLGQAEPLQIDIDALQQRFERSDHARIRATLIGLGLGSAIDLLSTYAGQLSDLDTWLAHAEINRDRNLRLQYLAGLRLDSDHGTQAYAEILGFRRFPDEIFIGAPERLQALQDALETGFALSR